jgi:hypothetical protein
MVNLEMLRLLRRVDSFLGADSMDKVSVLNALFDEIVSVSQDNINYLNRIDKADLDKFETRGIVTASIKTMIEKHITHVESLEHKMSDLEYKYKSQFLDALFCYVYHQVDEKVMSFMSGDKFIVEKNCLKHISPEHLYYTPCMHTKQAVLEYSFFDDTKQYWISINCLNSWFGKIVPDSHSAILELNEFFVHNQNDPEIDELIKNKANGIEQDHLHRIAPLYQDTKKTNQKQRNQLFDSLLCHIYHQIRPEVRSIMNRYNIFSTSLLKTSPPLSLHGQPCMKTRAEVLDYAVCCDTKAYWETFDRNR